MIANKLICKACGDKIVSMHRHDFVSCKCGACYIDGGRDYTRMGGHPEDYTMVKEEITESEKTAYNERSKLTPEDEAMYMELVQSLLKGIK